MNFANTREGKNCCKIEVTNLVFHFNWFYCTEYSLFEMFEFTKLGEGK